MARQSDTLVPPAQQPRPDDYGYDLGAALRAVVGIRSLVPDDAFTAGTLGTERAGHGVFIREGVALTIGYLTTEAETIWITLADGRVVPGHSLAYDQETGFGLVQALTRLDIPPVPLGRSAAVPVGTRVVLAGAGGRRNAVAARVTAKQEFAGYWEYVLDEAIFTTPAHPFWGGAALFGPSGDLLGIASLQIEQSDESGSGDVMNMVVPIDLLTPILDDLLTRGRTTNPPRPWLGLFATEVDGSVLVLGLAEGGPAEQAGLRVQDRVLSVAGMSVDGLAGFFRRIWELGPAGVEVPLKIERDGRRLDRRIASSARERFLKAPRLH